MLEETNFSHTAGYKLCIKSIHWLSLNVTSRRKKTMFLKKTDDILYLNNLNGSYILPKPTASGRDCLLQTGEISVTKGGLFFFPQKESGKSYLWEKGEKNPTKECADISAQRHKSIQATAHVRAHPTTLNSVQGWKLSLSAPSTRAALWQQQSSDSGATRQSRKIDLQLFHLPPLDRIKIIIIIKKKITASPRGRAPADTIFICPVAFRGHVPSAP